MSVRELTDRFVGLRVQRKIAGEDKPRIKNFSFRIPVRRQNVTAWRDADETERREIWARANALDTQWAELQNVQQAQHKHVFCPRSTRTNTGTTGIRYKWAPDSQGYVIEAFWINVTVSSKTRAASVRLGSRGWTAAWRLAVEKLVQFCDLDAAQAALLIKSVPNMKKLRIAGPTEKQRAEVLAETQSRKAARGQKSAEASV